MGLRDSIKGLADSTPAWLVSKPSLIVLVLIGLGLLVVGRVFIQHAHTAALSKVPEDLKTFRLKGVDHRVLAAERAAAQPSGIPSL